MSVLSVIFIVMISHFGLHVEAKRPNFVIIVADDLGIGDVGCFGNDTIQTPNIDNIAAHGVKLTHHLSAAAVCTPSRAALLTGRYPVRSGMASDGRNRVIFFVASSGGLPTNETTFAKVLQNHGYSTALIGKWHLGNDCEYKGDMCHHPLNHGFDYFYGLPLSNVKDFGEGYTSVVTSYIPNFCAYVIAIAVIGLSSAVYLLTLKQRVITILLLLITCIIPLLLTLFLYNIKSVNSILMKNGKVIEQPIKLPGLTQRFTQEAKEFLYKQSKLQKPFLLMLSFVHVHTALFTAPEFAGKSIHGRYGDNVEEMDWAVGEVLKTLKELNFINNSFLYFTSDNGGHIEERGEDGQSEGGYNGIYKGGKAMGGMEGGIRVPTLAMWSGHIPAATELSVPTSQMDVFPTILELAGIPIPTDRIIDGKTLLPLLQGYVDKSPHKFIFHYCGVYLHAVRYISKNDNTVWKVHYATPKWIPGKTHCEFVCQCYGNFVVNHEPPLLYNLTADPSEDHPFKIDSNPKFLKIIATINKAVKEHKDTVTTVPHQLNLWSSMWRPSLQPCCNFPRCHCSDPQYQS